MKHAYWGNVEEDWAGFSSDISFSNPFFDEQQVDIFLGEEFDEDGEEIEDSPTEIQLTEFAETYQDFIENIEPTIKNIQEKAFERYTNLYAHYYENPKKSGEPALHIDCTEKHNLYIKELLYIRILNKKTVKLSIRYALDTEHGMEFKIDNGQIAEVGGIAET